MKMKCPKCLMAIRDTAVAHNRDTKHIDRQLSRVCNASPTAPTDGDPCCCGADWLPNGLTGEGSDADDYHDV